MYLFWLNRNHNLCIGPINKYLTMHSGKRKIKGEKSYHPYVSNDLRNDQQFVQPAITEMLREVGIQADEYIVIESNNCSSQYKSSVHFHGMQLLANNWNVNT